MSKQKKVTPSPRTMKYWEQPKELNKITEWASNGLSKKEIAENMGISRTTLWEWEKKSKDILNSVHAGYEVKLEIVENAMFKRAIGYEYEEMHFKYDEAGVRHPVKSRMVHIPGDPSIQKYVANNTMPDKWQDRVTYEDTSAHEKLDKLLEEMESKANVDE